MCCVRENLTVVYVCKEISQHISQLDAINSRIKESLSLICCVIVAPTTVELQNT